MRRAAAGLLGVSLIMATGVVANARVRATRDAEKVANSFMRSSDLQQKGSDADFVVLPPQGNPAGTSDEKIARFPTRGSHLTILSSGNVKAATRANKSGKLSYNNRGPVLRGTRDAVMLRVKFTVPKGKNCLSFDFKFLSEEFPEC